jgi:hypothetical protein
VLEWYPKLPLVSPSTSLAKEPPQHEAVPVTGLFNAMLAIVGAVVGEVVGDDEGESVGDDDGDAVVGVDVGEGVGDCVGTRTPLTIASRSSKLLVPLVI